VTIPDDLLAFFVEYRATQVQALRAAAVEQRLDEVRRLAHNLRGSAAQFGFTELAAAALEIERAAKAGRASAVVAGVSRLEANAD
jgi:HPt (histidine-containing phosphotransfer) domain-containing protein